MIEVSGEAWAWTATGRRVRVKRVIDESWAGRARFGSSVCILMYDYKYSDEDGPGDINTGWS